MFESLTRDTRGAWRSAVGNSGLTAVVVLSLALGIGATTVVFSIVESVLLRPFPYPDPDRVVLLQGIRGPDATADLEAYRDQTTTIEFLGLYAEVRLMSPEAQMPVPVVPVGGDVFRVLGVALSLGQVFPSGDLAYAAAGYTAALEQRAPATVILSHGFWDRYYGSDPQVLGRILRLDGVPHEVVGVMPRGFFFPEPDVQLWTSLTPPTFAGYQAVGRLQPGVPLERARAEIDLITRRLDESSRPVIGNSQLLRRVVTVVPIRQAALSDYHAVLWLLLGAVTLVLLIACANVANLLLARGVARAKELAVRATLGASRVALIRQLLVESLVLSVVGGAAGVGLAVGGLHGIAGLGLVEIPRMDQAALNLPVLAFAVAMSLTTGLLTGIAPAWKTSRVDPVSSLKQGGHTSAQAGLGRVRQLLVVVEVALAVVLLVGAGLLVRSAVAMSRIPWGFRADGLSVAALAPPTNIDAIRAYVGRSQEAKTERTNGVLARLRAVPGVVAAGAATTLPLVRLGGGDIAGERVVADGAPVASAVTAGRVVVTPGFLTALGVDLRGRDFDGRDDAAAMRTVVLSERLARSLFGERDAIGQLVHFATLRESAIASAPSIVDPNGIQSALLQGGSEDIQDFEVTGSTIHSVIGVAGEVRLAAGGPADPVRPIVYVDARQFQDRLGERVPSFVISTGGMFGDLRGFAVRTAGSPGGALQAAREAIAERGETLAVAAPMRALVSQSLGGAGESGLILALSTVFGALSLLLATAGIYALVSHGVSQRIYEIGVRMALGARRRDVARMVVREGVRLAAIGLVIGLLGAWAASRVLESRLFGVTPTDPITFVGVTLFLLAIAAAASFLPARRASLVDPLVATRAE